MQAALVVSILAVGWTLTVIVTGGLTVDLGRLEISSRQALNPALFALAAAAVAYGLASADERRREWPPLVASAVAAAAVVAVVSFGLTKGLFVAAASDAYGYVSQADLWAKGDIVVRQPWAREMTWPNAASSLAPLGYRPKEPTSHGTDIVPIYSPGVPILMAVFKIAGGERAVYYLVPLLGGLAVWITFLMGRRLAGPAVGTFSALLLATSPTFLFEITAPASDVAATAWWSLALFALMFDSRRAALGAGAATGLAILTRPNVAPLALVLTAPLIWRTLRGEARERAQATARLLWFSMGAVPACVFVALLNRELYGSPLSSGYGSFGDLYALAHAWLNLARYPRWLIDTQTIVVIFAAAAPFVLPRSPAAMWLAAMVAIFSLYIFYIPFDDWWYLRFLMPMFPAMFVLTSAVLLRTVTAGRTWLAAVVVAALAWHGGSLAAERGASRVWEAEQRYMEAGAYVAAALPERAALVTMQHSGSARFYSGRITVRYDFIEPDGLDRVLDDLRRLGYHPYFLLDEAEEATFRTRFAAASLAGALDWPPTMDLHRGVVRIYDPANRP